MIRTTGSEASFGAGLKSELNYSPWTDRRTVHTYPRRSG